MLVVFETGVRYHCVHAPVLFAVAWVSTRRASGAIRAAGWLFVAGIPLSSGSLYILTLADARALRAITPFGGAVFILGRLLLGWGCLDPVDELPGGPCGSVVAGGESRCGLALGGIDPKGWRA